MDFEFIRHEPLYDRILLVLTLDRQKMPEWSGNGAGE